MYVSRMLFKDFRNIESGNTELSPGINILYGDNAQGKTNFLEAIYICSMGRSQRANAERELITFGKKEAYIAAVVNNESSYDKIDVHIKKDDKKGIAVNSVPIKKSSELFGTLLTVIFSPEDLQLIKSGPAERRKYMDVELCQLSGVYYYELQQYYKILKQRNNLLRGIIKNQSLRDTVFIWDEQLVNHGTKISAARFNFINKINYIAGKIHYEITNGTEKLEIIYKPNCTEDDFSERLKKNIEKDIALGSTSVGIHKDDLFFCVNGVDCRIYGSQGQQRTSSLSAKLAEIELINERKNDSPVLLLDDVLSELDKNRQKYLLGGISGMQTIITCTGVEDVLRNVDSKTNIYLVEKGRIIPSVKEC